MKKEKSSRWSQNIDNKGRLFRGSGAVVMAVAAIITWPKSSAAGIALALAAGFLGFEASRGWCALRACGVKTRF